ncbi:MAG: hypothetical protein ACOX9R_14885 [Armatimonadota bacterium]|jgi:uncharacterized protein (DUF2141 family)
MIRAMTVVLLALAGLAVAFAQVDEAPAQPPAGDADQDRGQVVVMRAVWPGGDLSNTSFRLFGDREMRVLMDILPAPDGEAMILLQPGEYFVMAVVDANGNNEVDAGDGFGFHGVTDLDAASQPMPLRVEEGQANLATISILMVLAEDGRLVPLPSAVERTVGTLQGSFQKGEGADTTRTRLLVVLPAADGARPIVHAIGPYEFELQVPPGAHRIAVIVDEDGSGTLTAGDLAALRGFGDDEPVPVDPGGTTVIGPLTLAPLGEAPEGIPPLIAGVVTGAQIPEGGRASVAFCTDPALRDEAFSLATDPAGLFAAVVAPGTYYLRVTIDAAGDGALGPGDMLGFFGVDDLRGEARPAPLEVTEDALHTNINVPISARMDEDGRLSAWPAADDAAGDAAENAGE